MRSNKIILLLFFFLVPVLICEENQGRITNNIEWIKKDELFNAEWNDSICKNKCLWFDSIETVVIEDICFVLFQEIICGRECQGPYFFDRTKNTISQITTLPLEFINSEFLFHEEYYFTIYSFNTDNEKYIEKGLLLLYASKPLEYRDYKFERNLLPRKVEKCDSLFCVTVYEYETEWRWGWTIFNTIFFWARGKPREYVHKYINSYMYKFDENLNLIEIEKLPLDMEEWKWSRKF